MSSTEVTETAPASDERRDALVARLGEELGDALIAGHVDAGRDVWVRVATAAWEDAGRVARDVLGLRYFGFLSAIDWLPSPYGRSLDAAIDLEAEPASGEVEQMEQGVTGGETRFQVFARLHSVTEHIGLTLKVDVPNDTLALATWTRLFGGANWHEREVFEMFGISFEGHPSLRKLYLPGDFEGHPLRKDFPLLSRMVKPWPGIVDVEPLPGGDNDEEGDAE